MSVSTESETITDFTQFNWDKSTDYYKGRLTKPALPDMKSQEDVEMFMGSIFATFKDDDKDIERFPIPCYGDTVKTELDK